MNRNRISIITALFAALTFGACGSTTSNGDSSDTSDDPAATETGDVGAGAENIFGGYGSDAAGLHVEGHTEGEPDAIEDFDWCGFEEPSGEILLSNTVLAGHYGRPSAGQTIDADTTCAESNYKSWEIVEVKIMDCTAGDLTFEGGSGIVSVAFTGGDTSPPEVSVYGTFVVDGASAHCDIVMQNDTFSADCEGDDGTSLGEGDMDNTCE